MVKLPFGKGGAGKGAQAKAVTRYPFVGAPLSQSWKVVDKYPLNAPFAYAVIAEDPSSGTKKYFVDEVTLSAKEASIYTYLLETLESELSVPRSQVDPRAYFLEQAKRLVKKYSIKASQLSWPKINYFAERDLVGFGVLDGVMRDTQIEDITVDGVAKPLFIFHRRYDSIETNLNFLHDEELDNIIARLAHMAGKHVSTAFPIVQGTLPGRHRLAATYRREISPYGGTLTIRKFREDPLTIIDMMNLNVIDQSLAAYVWLLMENRATAIVAGSTGSGKTTLLNALLTLTRMNSKIVTIEEVQEINIAHQNWSALVSRESYGTGDDTSGEVGLFQLVKATMRMRPDILVVGEVRGEEAYVLFQAISSVTGDTPVLVRDGDDAKLLPIADVVDRFYPEEAERVAVPVEGVEVLSFDSNKKVGFQPIQYVLRHKADEVYAIRYAGGEVRATGSHSVFVTDDNCEIIQKKVSDLKEGDTLLSFKGSDLQRKPALLDVKSILDKTDPGRVRTHNSIPACPNCSSKEVWRRGKTADVQNYSCKACKKQFKDGATLTYYDTFSSPDGNSRVGFARSRTLPAQIEVDPEFAKVLGIYLADGCVKHQDGSSKVVFCLGTPEKDIFLRDIQHFFQRYGSEPIVDDRGSYSVIEFNHSPLARVIEHLCGRELAEKKVPAFIWEAPVELADALLEGWRADSRRTLPGKSISYSSARPDLVNSLCWLARLNGRTSLINERDSKYRSALISKKDEQMRSDSIASAPLLNLKALLASTAWEHTPKKTNVTLSKRRARRALQEILSKKRAPLTLEAANLASRISSLLESNMIAAPILRVERQSFDGFVYDFSVPGTEAFFGGEAPVALHNTGHGGLCLPPWETVPFRLNGRLMVKPIEELFKDAIDPASLVKNGDQEIYSTRSELLVPSYNVAENRTQLARVKRVSRRQYNGRLLKLQTIGGNEGTVTDDHPILVLRHGRVERIPAKQAVVGDFVPCSGPLPRDDGPDAPREIDVIEHLARSPMRDKILVKSVRDLLYNATKGELARQLGVSERAIDDYRRRDYLPLGKYLLLKDENRGRRRLRYRKSPHSIPALISVDRPLTRLLGFYLAEGSAGEERLDFSFNTNETELIGQVRNSIAECFGVPSRIYQTGPNLTQVVVKDKLLCNFFTACLGVGQDSYSKRLPDFAYSMPRRLMVDVLDAYFLGDGCPYVGSDGSAGYTASTSSEQLGRGIYYLMLAVGYQVTMGRDKRSNSWKVGIAGGDNLSRFSEEFSAGASLRGKVEHGNPGAAEKVPIDYALVDHSNRLLMTKRREGNVFVSRQVLEEMGVPAPNGVYFAPVKQITEVDYCGYVYDLFEVETTHNFVHGLGLVTSNCTLHADDVTSAIQRLTSKPMDVPPSFIPFLDLVFTVRRIAVPMPGGGFRTMRRVLSVDEVVSVGNYIRMFKWDPASDKQLSSPIKSSVKLARLARDTGTTVPDLMDEIERRSIVLKWAQQREIRNFRELSLVFEEYRSHSKEIFERARDDLGKQGMVIQAEMREGFKL